MSELWDSICRVEKSDDSRVISSEGTFIVPKAKKFWDQSPHGAMETLECIAEVFPIAMAKEIVREIVLDWKSRPNYSWRAGGSADHCFLSALLLSGNGDLADDDFLEECLKSVVEKARSPRSRTKDVLEKSILIEGVVRKWHNGRETRGIKSSHGVE